MDQEQGAATATVRSTLAGARADMVRARLQYAEAVDRYFFGHGQAEVDRMAYVMAMASLDEAIHRLAEARVRVHVAGQWAHSPEPVLDEE